MNDDTKQLLNFYSDSLSDKFRKLAEPLEQYFRLNGLFYSVTTTQGQFFQISNHPELSEYYFSNGYHVHNPFICHPDNYSNNQMIITGDFPDQIYQEVQEKVEQRFGVGNALVIYKKIEDTMHIATFTSTDPTVPLNTIFLNNFSALNFFTDNFVNEWQSHQERMEAFMISLSKQMGSRFVKPNSKLDSSCDKSPREKFLKSIGAIRNNRDYIQQLSKREKECIDEFLKGKTANQIAKTLCLSPRTIEHYLENIKIKLNSFTKPELFEKLLAYRSHNLI